MLLVNAYEGEMTRGIFEEKTSYNEAYYRYIRMLVGKGCKRFCIIDLDDNTKFDIVDVEETNKPEGLIFASDEEAKEFIDRLHNEVYQCTYDDVNYDIYIIMAYDVNFGRFNCNNIPGINNANDYINALIGHGGDFRINITNLNSGEALNFTTFRGELKSASEDDEMRFCDLLIEEVKKIEKGIHGHYNEYYINLW